MKMKMSARLIEGKIFLIVCVICVVPAFGPIAGWTQVNSDISAQSGSAVLSQAEDASQSPAAQASPTDSERIRIGAFNVRMFPCNTDCTCLRHHGYDRCRRRARRTDLKRLAREIRKLDVDILAVNEILEPTEFSEFARSRLGRNWKFVFSPEGGPLKVGFLYDASKVTLMSDEAFTEIYTDLLPVVPGTSECRLKPGTRMRPAFACRFLVAGSESNFFLVNVHLKSGPCPGVRRQQWAILEHFVERLSRDDSEIVILGDFNDFRNRYRDVDDFKAGKDFTLISESIPCSFLGRRKAVTLDHILVSREVMNAYRPSAAKVGGPCVGGCGKSKYRKSFLKNVSDHCPIVTELRIGR